MHRAVILVCIFKSNPDAAHEMVWEGVKVDGVTVGGLFGANVEVQRLKAGRLYAHRAERAHQELSGLQARRLTSAKFRQASCIRCPAA